MSSILLLIFLHHIFAPADWVEVNLEQVPTDVSALYIVAKKQGVVFPLNWYQSMSYRFLANPKTAGQQWYGLVKDTERKGDLQWVTADSFGILARLQSGKWVLWWLKSESISGPSPLRYIFGGGEKVMIQALGIESSETASKQLVDQVKQ